MFANVPNLASTFLIWTEKQLGSRIPGSHFFPTMWFGWTMFFCISKDCPLSTGRRNSAMKLMSLSSMQPRSNRLNIYHRSCFSPSFKKIGSQVFSVSHKSFDFFLKYVASLIHPALCSVTRRLRRNVRSASGARQSLSRWVKKAVTEPVSNYGYAADHWVFDNLKILNFGQET